MSYTAAYSGGGGHGDYLLARILFPLPMLLTKLTKDHISIISIVLAVVQFPIYGWVFDRSLNGVRFFWALIAIAVVHAIGVAVCLSGAIPNFS